MFVALTPQCGNDGHDVGRGTLIVGFAALSLCLCYCAAMPWEISADKLLKEVLAFVSGVQEPLQSRHHKLKCSIDLEKGFDFTFQAWTQLGTITTQLECFRRRRRSNISCAFDPSFSGFWKNAYLFFALEDKGVPLADALKRPVTPVLSSANFHSRLDHGLGRKPSCQVWILHGGDHFTVAWSQAAPPTEPGSKFTLLGIVIAWVVCGCLAPWMGSSRSAGFPWFSSVSWKFEAWDVLIWYDLIDV